MSIGRLTFFMTISENWISWTSPPPLRYDLMRKPLSVPLKLQRRTTMWLKPPRVALPMEMPWPW